MATVGWFLVWWWLGLVAVVTALAMITCIAVWLVTLAVRKVRRGW
jgi:hypothetical protein